ncbi:MAG TPA: PilT/PilU family type 4a pilus ATPase [Methylomirabilota bacterium]|nr:PilT/PilU family type 4a pilus ATPase [Methylomirabilota bacterium]
MGKLLPDPELEKLIQEMNRSAAAERAEPHEGAWELPDLREVSPGGDLDELLAEMVRRGASDLLLVPGSAPVIRVHGRLEILPAAEVEERTVRTLFDQHVGPRARDQLAKGGAADFSLRRAAGDDGAGWRFRVNLQRQGGRLAAAVRALPRRIPTLEELHLPPAVGELVASTGGLVLVCGPTGSGKSTTLAALVDRLNRSGLRHVITIEDPVEYEHPRRRAVIEQVEVGSDAPAFAAALRSALRRDPDVLLVGEMRDLETIATVLTAAETGHLVLSTLHTGDAARAVHRIIDVFPAEQQEQIRHQLALSLKAVVCQQLVPTADGRGRVPAVELLLATYAVRNHIRRGQVDRLANELLSGRSIGMQSMEQALAALVRSGAVTADEARARANRPDELDRMLGSAPAP